MGLLMGPLQSSAPAEAPDTAVRGGLGTSERAELADDMARLRELCPGAPPASVLTATVCINAYEEEATMAAVGCTAGRTLAAGGGVVGGPLADCGSESSP